MSPAIVFLLAELANLATATQLPACVAQPWRLNTSELSISAEFAALVRGCSLPEMPGSMSTASVMLSGDVSTRILPGVSMPEICFRRDPSIATARLDISGLSRTYRGANTDDLSLTSIPDSNLLCQNGSLRISELETYTSSLAVTLDTSESLSKARYFIGTAIIGSKVFFGGGYYHGGDWSDVVDIFESSSRSWSRASLSVPRYGTAGAALRHVAAFFGGLQGKPSKRSAFNTVDIYNNSTDTWSATSLPSPPRGLGAATAAGDLLIFAGGRNADKGDFAHVDMYNIVTEKWTSAMLSAGRHGIAAVSVGTLALFAGGGTSYKCQQSCNIDDVQSDVVDIFDSATSSWSIASLSEARSFAAGVAHGSRAFFGGGDISEVPYTSKRVDIFNSVTGAWSISEFSRGRSLMAAAAAGKTVIFFGGVSRENGRDYESPSDEMDLFDVEFDTWMEEQASGPRFLAAGVSLDAGHAVFAGGFETESYSDTKLVEIVTVRDSNTSAVPVAFATVAASAETTPGNVESMRGRFKLPTKVDPLGVRISLPPTHGVYTGGSMTYADDSWVIQCSTTINGKNNYTFTLDSTTDEVCLATVGRCGTAKYSSGGRSRTNDVSECVKCPGRTTTVAPGARNASDCQCPPGHTGESCAPCPAGTFKDMVGASECIVCPAAKYSGAMGGNASSTCLPCPHGAVSPNGSTSSSNCSCKAGFTARADGETCVACEAGKFKTNLGTGECTQCPRGKYSAVYLIATGLARDTCKDCMRNTYSSADNSKCSPCPFHAVSAMGSSSRDDCQCAKGYTGPDGHSCIACVAGKYKAVQGASACASCTAGKFSTTSAATAESSCTACAANSYSASDNSHCVLCPYYAISSRASSSHTDCVCDVGFTGPNGGPCGACPAGKYKQVIGSSQCRQCQEGKFSTSVAATSITTCRFSCSPSSYSSADNSACLECPPHTVSAASSAKLGDCVCDLGYTGNDGGPCQACQPGKYKAVNGSMACERCKFGKYSSSSAATSAASCNVDLVVIAVIAAVVVMALLGLLVLACSTVSAAAAARRCRHRAARSDKDDEGERVQR